MKIIAIAVLLLGCSSACLLAEESKPTTAPASSVIAATDRDALDAHKGKDVTVEGQIESAKWSASGKVMTAHFADSEVVVAVFQSNKDKLDKQFSGDLTKALTGAKVKIKGKLEEFNGKPEIKIAQGSQITIETAGPTTAKSE